MRDLNYALKQLCHRNRDGSYATQTERERALTLMANQLHEMGYRDMQVDSLKTKHVNALVNRWRKEGIAVGTFKNRMAFLRWWAQKIGKSNIVARENHAYGIPNRQYVSNVSKARSLQSEELAKLTDARSAMSLKLQAAFGLRREESIKFNPSWADRGDRIVLKDTWCKGGRARSIPVLTEAQRALLHEAKALFGKDSLIPVNMTYKQQLDRFRHQCKKAGIHKVHGHRHYYAQERFQQIAGFPCPARGGPIARKLTPEQAARDYEARLIISRELGHEREQVTAIYLGR